MKTQMKLLERRLDRNYFPELFDYYVLSVIGQKYSSSLLEKCANFLYPQVNRKVWRIVNSLSYNFRFMMREKYKEDAI